MVSSTSCREGSSRISASLRASLACGLRFEKAAARSGSFAKNETSSPPPTYNFDVMPVVTGPAYAYSGKEELVEH